MAYLKKLIPTLLVLCFVGCGGDGTPSSLDELTSLTPVPTPTIQPMPPIDGDSLDRDEGVTRDEPTIQPMPPIDGDCPSKQETFAQMLPATYAIVIECPKPDDPSTTISMGFATAFAIQPRLLGTNAHVVEGILSVSIPIKRVVAVQSGTGNVFEIVSIARYPDYNGDPLKSPDVGVLRTAQEMPQTLDLSPDAILSVGDEMALTGFPGDVNDAIAITPGITVPQATSLNGTVSALRSFDTTVVVTPDTVDTIQHQLPTTPGTSGSPLVLCGKVVAVHNAGTARYVVVYKDGQLVLDRQVSASNNFGIHIKYLQILADLVTAGILLETPVPSTTNPSPTPTPGLTPTPGPTPNPTPTPMPPVDQIVPGVSLGPVVLGDTWTRMIDIAGIPDEYDNATGWFHYKALGINGFVNDLNQDRVIDPNDTIQCLLGDTDFKGKYCGVGIFSTPTAVINAMGNIGPTDGIIGDTIYYRSRGIEWRFYKDKVFGVSVFSPTNEPLPSYSSLFFPGISLGPVVLGDTWGKVRTLLGIPAFYDPKGTIQGYGEAGIYIDFTDTNKDGIITPDEPAGYISGFFPFAGTYLGLGIGSALTNVVNILGNPNRIVLNKYGYDTLGTEFDFENSQVKSIFIFLPYGFLSANSKAVSAEDRAIEINNTAKHILEKMECQYQERAK